MIILAMETTVVRVDRQHSNNTSHVTALIKLGKPNRVFR